MGDSAHVSLVLPVEACSSGEPQTIASFPGRWIPGVAYAPSAIGLTVDEAERLLAAVPTPLVWSDEDGTTAFSYPEGSRADSGFQDVEADRAAEATRVAEPVVTDSGDVAHPGFLPPPVQDLPPAVAAQIAADTATSAGTDAVAEFEAGLDGMSKAELVDLADRLGVDSSGTKASLVEALKAHGPSAPAGAAEDGSSDPVAAGEAEEAAG